jgi:hypothetical protein
MKNYITILLMSLAIIGCQTPTADPNGRTLIDPSDLIEISDAFDDALNSADIEKLSSMLSEDVSWAFPNGVTVEGKEAVTELLAGVSQIWTTIDQNSGDTVHLGVTGGEEGEEWKVLLSWGEATYANEATSISIPYHQVTWFTEDNLIAGISGLYDRTELVASYDEDPIK